MIDALLCYAGQRREPLWATSYRAEQAISGVSYRKASPQSDTLTVVFPPWHAPGWFMQRVQHRLARRGDVLSYNFSGDILSDESRQVKDSFEFIADTVSNDVRCLNSEKQVSLVNLLGFSLGNVALSMTAEQLDSFHAITMVVPGTDLLTGLWHGKRTQLVRAGLERKGNTYEQLKAEWSQLAPIAHIDVMRGHPLKLVLAEDDIIIPIEQGSQYVDILQAAGLNPEINIAKNRGHVSTILHYGMQKA